MKHMATILVLVVLVASLVPAALARERAEPGPTRPTVATAAAPAGARPESVLYFWNLEANDGGFAGTLDWEWGSYAWDGSTCDGSNFPPPAAHSGVGMWGTVLNNCYDNLGNNQGYASCANSDPSDDSVLSFSIDLSGVTVPVELSWWEWYDLFSSFDWAEVYANGTRVFPHCEPSFVQPTAWVQQTVDLTPYAGGPVTIEFHMMASTVVNHAGWYIDDVLVRTTFDDWKEAPPYAETGQVISYTIVISAPALVPGMYMIDPLPTGVAYAGNLAWSDGSAWYDGGSNTVNWQYIGRTASAPAAPRPAGHEPGAAIELVGGPEPAGPAPAAPAAAWNYPEAVLWDNGPLVTHPGDCAGTDASRLQTGLGMNTLGLGHQFAVGNRIADDFEIANPLGWQIDTITFFAYQTGAPSDPSPFTGLYLQIWNGSPDDPGSTVVWGDLTTNRLLSSAFTNIQRDSETDPCANSRYIFANVAAVGTVLPPGVYWLDWMADGSASYNGPWAPPITILGQTTTGNALQYTTSSGAWGPANDSGTLTQQGMPFVIEGSLPSTARVEISFDVTVTAACGAVIVNEGVAGLSSYTTPFSATTQVVGDADIAVAPAALWATLHPDTTATRTLGICSLSACPLNWVLYEQPPFLAMLGSPFAPVAVAGPGRNHGLTMASPPVRPAAVLAAVPQDVLWDQPLSTANQAAYVDQEFPDFASYSSFLADDFTNAESWLVTGLFVPGDGWAGFTTLMHATALTWQFYADCGGVPCGDPAGGGAAPVWNLTLPPDHPRVTISAGTPGGMPSNVHLELPLPGVLPPGTWWLVFFPTMEYAPFGQYGRQAADTTNGHTAQFINPGGGFGLGTDWQNWTVLGPTQQDIAFRIEGVPVPPLADIPWLSESPISGTVAGGGCQDVAVTFDATGMAVGDYYAHLLVVSDDPDTPQVDVPVTMVVVDTGSIYLPLIVRH